MKRACSIEFKRQETIGYSTIVEAETAEEALALFQDGIDCDWEEEWSEGETEEQDTKVVGSYPIEGGSLTKLGQPLKAGS